MHDIREVIIWLMNTVGSVSQSLLHVPHVRGKAQLYKEASLVDILRNLVRIVRELASFVQSMETTGVSATKLGYQSHLVICEFAYFSIIQEKFCSQTFSSMNKRG